jgi:hypothetical protein
VRKRTQRGSAGTAASWIQSVVIAGALRAQGMPEPVDQDDRRIRVWRARESSAVQRLRAWSRN